MLEFERKYGEYLEFFNEKLNDYINGYVIDCPKILSESMKYAVTDGGKRIRPILLMATADALGVNLDEIIFYAYAIEFIHSYSLVHDDLPAMDNDDYRRGKLSTHKKFGEAFGILAGDGLLNLAFETCLKKPKITNLDISAMRILFDLSGAKGMVKGQVLDLQNEKNPVYSKELLYEIFENKTAKLISAPILIASKLAGDKCFEELKNYSYNIGILFQIIDDILDVEGDFNSIGKTPNKDENSDKLTSIKIFGLEKAKKIAEDLYVQSKIILNNIPNSEFLQAFTDKMYFRKN